MFDPNPGWSKLLTNRFYTIKFYVSSVKMVPGNIFGKFLQATGVRKLVVYNKYEVLAK